MQGQWIWLVVFAVVMAAVSVYYYFKVIRAMYFEQGTSEMISETTAIEKALLIANAVLIILLGLFPDFILEYKASYMAIQDLLM